MKKHSRCVYTIIARNKSVFSTHLSRVCQTTFKYKQKHGTQSLTFGFQTKILLAGCTLQRLKQLPRLIFTRLGESYENMHTNETIIPLVVAPRPPPLHQLTRLDMRSGSIPEGPLSFTYWRVPQRTKKWNTRLCGHPGLEDDRVSVNYHTSSWQRAQITPRVYMRVRCAEGRTFLDPCFVHHQAGVLQMALCLDESPHSPGFCTVGEERVVTKRGKRRCISMVCISTVQLKFTQHSYSFLRQERFKIKWWNYLYRGRTRMSE